MNSDTIRSKLLPAMTSRLDALANGNQAGASSLSAQLDEVSLSARLHCVDRLACKVESITVSSPLLRNLNVAQLRDLADRLANQLTYLEESLVVVEMDQVTPEVQMRSQSPRKEEKTSTYFEVQVGQKGIGIRRFEKKPGEARRAITAVLTRDILCRLCVDVVAAVHD